MRRYIIIASITLIVIVVAALLIYGLIRARRLPKTVVGWRASVSTWAGNGAPGFRDDPARTQATFAGPFGVVVATDGTVYVSDSGDNNRIRKITREGKVETFAGNGQEAFADGPGLQAAFNTPSGLA